MSLFDKVYDTGTDAVIKEIKPKKKKVVAPGEVVGDSYASIPKPAVYKIDPIVPDPPVDEFIPPVVTPTTPTITPEISNLLSPTAPTTPGIFETGQDIYGDITESRPLELNIMEQLLEKYMPTKESLAKDPTVQLLGETGERARAGAEQRALGKLSSRGLGRSTFSEMAAIQAGIEAKRPFDEQVALKASELEDRAFEAAMKGADFDVAKWTQEEENRITANSYIWAAKELEVDASQFAQKLNLDKAEFMVAADQWEQAFDEEKRQFVTKIMYDKYEFDTMLSWTKEEFEKTYALEKQKLEESIRQFNKEMDIKKRQFKEEQSLSMWKAVGDVLSSPIKKLLGG